MGTSGQGGGVGRQASPPHTTIKITTNLKTKYNHSFQKTELYGSLTTKDLKKMGRRVEMESWGREDQVRWRSAVVVAS